MFTFKFFFFKEILFLQPIQSVYNYITNGLNQINDDDKQMKTIEQAFEILNFDQVCLSFMSY